MRSRSLTPAACAVAALCLLVAAAGCSSDEPRLEPTRFESSWRDLNGEIQGRFDVNGWAVARGGEVELRYELDVELDDLALVNLREGVTGVWVAWAGERLFDGDGHYRQMANNLMSTTLTTTGVAVENAQAVLPSRSAGHFYGTPFDFADFVPLEDGRVPRRLRLEGGFTRTVDESVPDGLYRLTFDLIFESERYGRRTWGLASFLGRREPRFIKGDTFDPRYATGLTTTFYPRRMLPMIQVGEVKRPRMPWVLFSEVGPNGVGGIVAREDRDRFALSTRLRYPSDYIMPPGERALEPFLPTVFPRAATTADMDGAGLVHDHIEHHLDFGTGEVSIAVTDPQGEEHDLGTHGFVGRGPTGPKLANGPPRFSFDAPGRYEVRMTGWIQDQLGRRIEGGGHYELWVGQWLTFSTTVKHGMPMTVGGSYPFKGEIHPPYPADVEVVVDFYPGSDPSRRQRTVVRGRANSYGYFYAHPEQGSLSFDEPGEYRSEMSARYVDPRGMHWYGHQTAVGIVEGPDSRVALHGMRMQTKGVGDLLSDEPRFGYAARWEGEESNPTLSFLEMVDCHDRMVPFLSGDVLHHSATWSRSSNIAAYFSMEPRDPALRRTLTEAFRPTPLTTPIGIDPASLEDAKLLPMRPEQSLDVLYLLGEDERADMFPILYRNRDGLQPMLFPETNVAEAYTYVSVIRPGFSAFVLAADGAPTGAYWATSPNTWGGQLSAGVNGDMPNDIYLVRAGLVYKDLETGRVDYGSYASAIVIDPNETDRNRVVAPATEPLFTVNGRPQWLTLGMASNVVAEVGDRVSLGAGVIPPVPAEVEITMTRPDGVVDRRAGKANRLGGFAGGTAVLDVPGVYKVKALTHYGGKTGDLLGSGDGIFNHYAVPRNGPDVLAVDLPPVGPYDVTEVLTLPLRIREGYRDAKISYSVLMPGMIMDEGELTPRDGAYDFRFMASQYAMQFPNFDATDHGWGRPQLNDLVVFVFFVEARDEAGEPVYDAERVVLRGERYYHVPHPLGAPRVEVAARPTTGDGRGS